MKEWEVVQKFFKRIMREGYSDNRSCLYACLKCGTMIEQPYNGVLKGEPFKVHVQTCEAKQTH